MKTTYEYSKLERVRYRFNEQEVIQALASYYSTKIGQGDVELDWYEHGYDDGTIAQMTVTIEKGDSLPES